MRNKGNPTAARLAAVLLSLVMIAGSFSAFAFADAVTDEESPAIEQQTTTIEQPSAGGNETASDEEQSVSDVQPESAGEQPEATAEESEITEGQPETAAEETGPALSGAVKSEAKNEESTKDPANMITITCSKAGNGTVSAVLKKDGKETAITSGSQIDKVENAGATIEFTGQPEAGYVVKQFSIKNGSEEPHIIPGDKLRPDSINRINVTINGTTGDLSFSAEFEIKKYKVEVISDDPGEGSVTADKTNAAEGETVTFKVVPAAGYRIDYAAYKYDKNNDNYYEYVYLEADPATGTYSFKMPAKDVYVEAGFFKPVTVQIKTSKGGSVTLKDRETGKEIKSGDEVAPYRSIVVSAKAKSGYSFKEWKFTAANDSYVSFFKRDSYFRMPNDDVTVQAVFTKNSSSGSGSGSTSYSVGSDDYYDEDEEEPEEEETEELTEEEQEMLDVTPLVSRVVAETVLTATTSLFTFMK